mmetsp:Transcript_20678/g.61772  ORF Transcript_20678/g.61772 Transcript_20678/m.61772 type:complete len:221 (-) Transcript_20678:2228-2890(-)
MDTDRHSEEDKLEQAHGRCHSHPNADPGLRSVQRLRQSFESELGVRNIGVETGRNFRRTAVLFLGRPADAVDRRRLVHKGRAGRLGVAVRRQIVRVCRSKLDPRVYAHLVRPASCARKSCTGVGAVRALVEAVVGAVQSTRVAVRVRALLDAHSGRTRVSRVDVVEERPVGKKDARIIDPGDRRVARAADVPKRVEAGSKLVNGRFAHDVPRQVSQCCAQ